MKLEKMEKKKRGGGVCQRGEKKKGVFTNEKRGRSRGERGEVMFPFGSGKEH